jgi:aminomethyltransferase
MTTFAEEYQALIGSAGSWSARGEGQIEVSGPDAHAFVNRVATADLSLLAPGRFIEALLLRDDASLIAQVTIVRFPDRVLLRTGPDTRAAMWEQVLKAKRGNVRLRDISDDVASISVRGPATAARLAGLLKPFPEDATAVVAGRLAGVDVFASRVPLEGPEGLDLSCRARDRDALANALATAGVIPVGPDAWHLMQIEWGVPRLGIEVDPGDTPVEAGLEHLVAEGKGAPFPGETALAARRRAGAIKRLVGFRVASGGLPPVAARVSVAGLMVDRVRSVARSPRVGVIGITALPITAQQPGTEIVIEAGGDRWVGTIARRPFVGRNAGVGEHAA